MRFAFLQGRRRGAGTVDSTRRTANLVVHEQLQRAQQAGTLAAVIPSMPTVTEARPAAFGAEAAVRQRLGALVPRGRTVVFLGLMLLVGIGVARIAATYHVFTQTFDEPYHLACGMEWWDQGRYQYERLHPPLARIAIALGPYLDGLHSMRHPYTPRGTLEEGNGILYSRNTYQRNLTLARLGILLFFVIATALVWLWSNRVFGRPTAWAATLLFTTLPPILAHSGLATTDMAITAFLGVAVYAFTRCLGQPDVRRTLALGTAIGLAVLSKFTAFLFLPTCLLSLVALRWAVERPSLARFPVAARSRSRALALSLVVALLCVWAGYRFSLTRPLKAGGQSQAVIDRALGSTGRLHDLGTAIAKIPMPLGELLAGLGSAWDRGQEGHPAYLLGAYSTQGWWYFFPIVLAVKTPLAFLILVAIGILFLVRRARAKMVWQEWSPICCAASILLVCLPSKVNAGVRHILPIYPMSAIVAGFGAASLLANKRHRGAITLGAALLAWHLLASGLAHPDYLSYFNELAGSRPERILAESDLDWGQDLNRLSQELKHLGVQEVALAYFGTADVTRHGLPAIRPLVPYEPTTGWVAISIYNLKVKRVALRNLPGTASRPYEWLERHQPVARAGKSILLYYLPQEHARPTSAGVRTE